MISGMDMGKRIKFSWSELSTNDLELFQFLGWQGEVDADNHIIKMERPDALPLDINKG